MRTMTKVIFGLCVLPLLSVYAGGDNLPGLAKQMKSKYERDVAFAVAPIEERYVKDLTNLYKDLTRSSDLDGALAVKQELTSVLSKPFVGNWTYQFGAFEIHPDGTAKFVSGMPGKVDIIDDDLVIKWENGFSYAIKLSQRGKTIRFRETDTGGTRRDYEATRS